MSNEITLVPYKRTRAYNNIIHTDKVFISGPMSNIPNYNREEFWEVGEFIEKNFKCAVFNPAHTDPHGLKRYEDLLMLCILQIKEATKVVLLPNWENSYGATAEHAVADALKKEMFLVKR